MLRLFSLQCQGRACCHPLLISHTRYTLNFLLCPRSPKLPNQCLQSSTGHAILATKDIEIDYHMFYSLRRKRHSLVLCIFSGSSPPYTVLRKCCPSFENVFITLTNDTPPHTHTHTHALLPAVTLQVSSSVSKAKLLI